MKPNCGRTRACFGLATPLLRSRCASGSSVTDNPADLNQRHRLIERMRMAGVPEGWVPPSQRFDVRLGSDFVKKVEHRRGPNFLASWTRFSDVDTGALITRPRLNGASARSICGGS